MKVMLDHGKCVGHGLCFLNSPEVFEPDDEGYGHVIGNGEVTSGHEQAARAGEMSCPERAISLGE